ncbi:superoxide dismutase family protein [Paenibacillus sp. N4]|uniref:superoxide dismutase family protein n=1 Tax=Paenibacillus vietnamensis TaxID=2590547 RepID=UPI001CD1490F|nr:superoxide dismutase family protein [Paenibacillus vietnamensis]MCA0757341.1 superoxide dismutase family protein [Paenibacillus vietnamensis]
MKKMMLLAGLLLAGQSFGAAMAAQASSEAPMVLVSIVNGQGETIGKAQLTEQAGKVQIHIEAEKLAPGTHGVHFHNVGKCDTPDFTTAGEHFNPQMKQHGFNNPKGYHSGDLPNIVVGEGGKVSADLTSADVTLLQGQPNSLLKEGGTALVIHEKADDYVTDPSGNSGSRIACGVIK